MIAAPDNVNAVHSVSCPHCHTPVTIDTRPVVAFDSGGQPLVLGDRRLQPAFSDCPSTHDGCHIEHDRSDEEQTR